MKKIKFFTALGLIIYLFFCSTVVFADADVVVSLQIDNPLMKINGEEVEIDVGRGTTPVITEGRTLVPIRAIVEAFGGVVGWEESTNSVILTMEDDTVKLAIGSNVAYFNEKQQLLDVAPEVINERTMLPIRFVAESFNIGVAWESDTQTVSLIRNSFDDNEYQLLMSVLPEYSGEAYVSINNNIPYFKEYEIIGGSFEFYSELDELGRCDVCFSSVATDLMPTEERKSISDVTPSGWLNAKYGSIEGGYLYNRCHLIGFQLTGENANERNLITGTRYLNINGMLPFENMIAEYIEKTGNRVMYRVTPVFSGNNLVADGVLMEAYSVEDNGEGISFCVYCYNVQPNININYLTGESFEKDNEQDLYNEKVLVYITPSGKRYHFEANCGGKNSFEILLSEAKIKGFTPCLKCVD